MEGENVIAERIKYMITLGIDTANQTLAIGVVEDKQILGQIQTNIKRNHSVTLMPAIDQLFADLQMSPQDIDQIAVSDGPGSYTGLRIGVSMAKGICYGHDVKLIAVPTLELLTVPVLLRHEEMEDNALLVPMLDARRMEVYAQVFDRALTEKKALEAVVIDENSYKEYLDKGAVYFFGNGAEKCKDVIKHPNAHFIEGIEPLAKYMFPLAEKRFLNDKFEDVAYFVPTYLKDFVAKAAKPLL